MDLINFLIYLLFFLALILISIGFYNTYFKESENEDTYFVKIVYMFELKSNHTITKDILIIKEDGYVIRSYYKGINSIKRKRHISDEEMDLLKKYVINIKIKNQSTFGCSSDYNETEKKMLLNINVSGELKSIIICNNLTHVPKNIKLLLNELETVKSET